MEWAISVAVKLTHEDVTIKLYVLQSNLLSKQGEVKSFPGKPINFRRETCNMIVIVQHPGEEPYAGMVPSWEEGSPIEVLMIEAPPLNVKKKEDEFVEGILEDVNDSDFEIIDESKITGKSKGEKVKDAEVCITEAQVEIDLDPRMP